MVEFALSPPAGYSKQAVVVATGAFLKLRSYVRIVSGAPIAKAAKTNKKPTVSGRFAWCGTANGSPRNATECDAEGQGATRGVVMAW